MSLDDEHITYQESTDCSQRAWEWAYAAQPDHLLDRVLDAYVGTDAYNAAFERWCRRTRLGLSMYRHLHSEHRP